MAGTKHNIVSEDEDGIVRSFPVKARSEEAEARRTAEPQPYEPETIAPAADDTPPARRSRRKLVLPVLIVAAIAAGAYYGHDYWTVGRFMVSTDDAYVHADIATIAPKIGGYVSKIAVTDNQRVKAGDVLLTLDDGDYRIALDQAKAAIATQEQTLKRIGAQIEAARASVDQARAQKLSQEAALKNAQTTAERARSLHKSAYAPQSQVDDAEAALSTAQANLAGGAAAIAAALANVDVLRGQLGEAQSQLRTLHLSVDQAERNLAQTVLKAPYDGVVGNRAVEEGNFVSPGQRLAAIVPLHSLYVEANLKETQLANIVPGEKVQVAIDALDGHTVEGTVSSISPASGSMFSLLPADNATGNFTKVVQRVPVRIDLPENVLESGKLRAGLSVIVDIDTRTAPDKVAAN